MNSDTVHIGVDVSKEKLDIYVPAKREGSRSMTKEVDNDIKGFRELRDLARKAGATVCVEPTGGYELELIAFMHKFGVPIAKPPNGFQQAIKRFWQNYPIVFAHGLGTSSCSYENNCQ